MTMLRPNRRELLSAAIAAGLLPLLPRAALAELRTGPASAFSYDTLREMARELARAPYAPTPIGDEALLESIDYDLHNQISYREDATLWGDVPGAAKVRFFHPGRYFKQPVEISVVENGEAREILFSPDLFDMPEGHPARRLTEAGFAGFRVMDPDAENDWLAVLGASYFRTSGWSGQFGLSARGLAIDSGGPGPEEFPRFTRFWLEQAPAGGVVIYALLDSPRATGAYRLEHGARGGRGGLPGHRRADLPARPGGAAGDRAADLDVLVRQEQPLGRAGLAAGDPRQRRAGDAPRQRRAHLAAAEQPAAGDGQRLRRRERQGLRAGAARAQLRGVPGRRGVLREAGDGLDRAAAATGARAR